MAERLSTGFVNAVNVTGSVKTIMNDSVLHIFGGASQPATADAAETGTLLMIVTVDAGAFVSGAPGNGLSMDASVGGVLSKTAAEAWEGLGLAAASTGTTATWYRWYGNTVVTGISTTAIRVDGSVGTSSTNELQLTNAVIAENSPLTIDTWTYTTPKA